MLFHYALVDDLVTKEEFEQRVERKIDDCGDLVDEPTAAMMVVGELGRAHVKIRGLSAKSSLFSFFGKVIDKTEPKIFVRADSEKGAVATILLGDETGTVRVVLWDERAGIVDEISPGDVLEIIGRHPGKSGKEIYALALRKASCQVECSVPPGGTASLKTEPVDLDMVLLAIGKQRTYTRRDGTTADFIDALAGDSAGTARIVAWVPDLIAKFPAGSVIHITGARPNTRGEGRGYSLDERSTVTPTDAKISVPFSPLDSITDQGIYSVRGTVTQVREPRPFTTRGGERSWVRNVVISDGAGSLRIVLWGEHGLLHVEKASQIEIYHGTAKPGRYGDIELHAGKDACVRIPGYSSEEIFFPGTIITDQGHSFIDDGEVRYILEGPEFHFGHEVAVTGTISGNRIRPERCEPVQIPVSRLQRKIRDLQNLLGESPPGKIS